MKIKSAGDIAKEIMATPLDDKGMTVDELLTEEQAAKLHVAIFEALILALYREK